MARRQLLAAGLSGKAVHIRLERGSLIQLHRGVYAAGHDRLRREGFWLAAVLAVGPGAVLSHRDAAALHGIRAANGSKVDVSTRSDRAGSSRIRVHVVRGLDRVDVTTVSGIPVTTVARTLVDLASAVAPDHLRKALREADRLDLLDADALSGALKRTRGRSGPGHAALTHALAEHANAGATLTRSTLEDRFVALVAKAGLPTPRMNGVVAGMEVDALWAQQRVAVELDGWAYHSTRAAFQRDRTKGNALATAGCTVLRFTHDDVAHRPAAVIERLRGALP